MSGDDLRFEPTGDELQDREYPDAQLDDDDDELTETVTCPHCGVEVYEDAVECPACQTYITHRHNVWSGRPAWWIILGLLGVLAAILALLAYSAR